MRSDMISRASDSTYHSKLFPIQRVGRSRWSFQFSFLLHVVCFDEKKIDSENLLRNDNFAAVRVRLVERAKSTAFSKMHLLLVTFSLTCDQHRIQQFKAAVEFVAINDPASEMKIYLSHTAPRNIHPGLYPKPWPLYDCPWWMFAELSSLCSENSCAQASFFIFIGQKLPQCSL